MIPAVHVIPLDVDRRLRELGIPSADILRRAAQAGHSARVMCSPNDPPSYPGTAAWAHTLRALREELLATGSWRGEDPGNFSLTVNDRLGVNLYVSSGDAFTGRLLPFVRPSTKSPKGLYAEAAVKLNLAQGDFFGIPEELLRKASALGYPTWFFLVYITDEEIRAELSFPEGFEGGEIKDWKERIIVPDIPVDLGALPGATDLGADIDVPVRRRS